MHLGRHGPEHVDTLQENILKITVQFHHNDPRVEIPICRETVFLSRMPGHRAQRFGEVGLGPTHREPHRASQPSGVSPWIWARVVRHIAQQVAYGP